MFYHIDKFFLIAYPTDMSFRENLKSELTYQGMLVKELAEKTGISKRTLDNYLREKGSIPPVDAAVKIARALNVTVEYLAAEGEENSNSDGMKKNPLLQKYECTLKKLESLPESKRQLIIKLIEEM